ncbi:hypothetical protein C8R41DRAFT_981534 [Lentinula lateritia]|uniref:Protein kinase domain-containing protein n=1 Tax=Lentinula lateritia TaxID=40482 RepID=A0ABQ8VDX8_9AGAR|nr:hypothetical protein C8R41DRAFT_981534 [Lentinula lateritia]
MNSSSLIASQNILELVVSNEPLLNGIIDSSGGPLFVFLFKDSQTRTVRSKRVALLSDDRLRRGTVIIQVKCASHHLDRPSKCPWNTATNLHIHLEHTRGMNHLPTIYQSCAIKFHQQSSLKEKFDNGYQTRLLRCSIQDELQLLMSLKSSKEYAQAFYDVVQCHHWGWRYPRILHRDISIGNIMVREKNGQKYGVLNDWDLASWLSTQNEVSTSKFRTGTKPYMAHEQHSSDWQGPHRFRHDLESLFYVILLLVSLYSSPTEKVRFPSTGDHRYEKWHKEDDSFLDGRKSKIINGGNWQSFPQPFFSGFTLWLAALQKNLRRGIFNLENHKHAVLAASQPLKPGRRPPQVPFFDEDTLGGYFSYEKVVMIMHWFNQEELKTWGQEWQVTLEEAFSEDWESEASEESYQLRSS